jgi:hypothetical protein
VQQYYIIDVSADEKTKRLQKLPGKKMQKGMQINQAV